MDEKEILDSIKSRLSEMRYEYDSLSESQKKHLLKIEPELLKRLHVQQSALNSLKDNKVNVASISSAIGITRKTIYNNDLTDYIEYVSEIYDSNNPLYVLSELRGQLNESKEIIEKMVRRDASVENLKSEIDELRKEIAGYKDQVQGLTGDNIDLSNKLHYCEQKKKTKSSLNIVK